MDDMRPIETRYKGYRFRSRLEARWAVFFDALGIPWQYEPQGFVLPDGSTYLPDFYLPSIGRSGRWIEIKPLLRNELGHPGWPRHRIWTAAEALEPEAGSAVPAWMAEKFPEFTRLYGNFILIAGDPYYDESRFDPRRRDYVGYVHGDTDYLFCECARCGAIGIEYDGRAGRIPCACPKSGDKEYNADSPRLLRAYQAARGARFEHGESPDGRGRRRG